MRVKALRWICILAVALLIGAGSSMAYEDQACAGAEAEAEAESKREKVVYLTFDDGPTQGVTEKILDVLKQYDVKGTFFVVGKEIPKREAILKRMYEEGHGIGLHTYSHNYKRVYSSHDIFLEEMDQTQEKINEVLGTTLEIKAIRFPGGSAGRLNQNFFDSINQKGYKIFDWNVNLEDGVNPGLSPAELVRNAKKCKANCSTRIILAHCNSTNKSTYQALPGIIEYYQKEGYVFKAIDNETPQYYYRFKK
ncbi:MAG: polysaccharide deacetylase family protein [Cellulosilyticaceae bacterium]